MQTFSCNVVVGAVRCANRVETTHALTPDSRFMRRMTCVSAFIVVEIYSRISFGVKRSECSRQSWLIALTCTRITARLGFQLLTGRLELLRRSKCSKLAHKRPLRWAVWLHVKNIIEYFKRTVSFRMRVRRVASVHAHYGCYNLKVAYTKASID